MNSGFRFENPAAFEWLWFMPILIGLTALFTYQHAKKIRRFISNKMYPFLTATLSVQRRRLKLALECFVILFFVLALARPQSGKSEQNVKSEGIELMVLFDVSRSMLAEDVRPSRLEFAKKEIERFLDKTGDRVGLMAFAGSAVLLSPLTSDKNAVDMFIDSLTTDTVSTQGTEFKRALLAAKDAFARGGVEGDKHSIVTRAVVVISDGEDNEPGAVDAAKQLKDAGIRIFSLGVGTEKGGAIPIRDEAGNLRGYRKNKSGKVILTRTQGKILRELAEVGDGSFYHLTYGGSGIESLIRDLKKLQQSVFDSTTAVNYDEKFQWLLFLGIIVALIELILGERRPQGRVWKGRFEVAEQ